MSYLFFAGLAAIVAGTALIYWPAAIVVAGILASGVALRLGGES